MKRLSERLRAMCRHYSHHHRHHRLQTCSAVGCKASRLVPSEQVPLEVCSVCLEGEEGPTRRVAMVENCDHVMHEACAKKWFAIQRSCPLCRQPTERMISSMFIFVGEEKRLLFEHHDRYCPSSPADPVVEPWLDMEPCLWQFNY